MKMEMNGREEIMLMAIVIGGFLSLCTLLVAMAASHRASAARINAEKAYNLIEKESHNARMGTRILVELVVTLRELIEAGMVLGKKPTPQPMWSPGFYEGMSIPVPLSGIPKEFRSALKGHTGHDFDDLDDHRDLTPQEISEIFGGEKLPLEAAMLLYDPRSGDYTATEMKALLQEIANKQKTPADSNRIG
jgi:hypothetical protein